MYGKIDKYPRKQASSTEYPSSWDQCQRNLRPSQYVYINIINQNIQNFPLECLVPGPWIFLFPESFGCEARAVDISAALCSDLSFQSAGLQAQTRRLMLSARPRSELTGRHARNHGIEIWCQLIGSRGHQLSCLTFCSRKKYLHGKFTRDDEQREREL